MTTSLLASILAETLKITTPTVEDLINHFTIRSDGDVLPESAFSRIETGAMENDYDSNDWLDIVFADDFDTNSLSENLTIEYDGAGGLIGPNGDAAPAFTSELRIDNDDDDGDDNDPIGGEISLPDFERAELFIEDSNLKIIDFFFGAELSAPSGQESNSPKI